jgi:hypothetical protein
MSSRRENREWPQRPQKPFVREYSLSVVLSFRSLIRHPIKSAKPLRCRSWSRARPFRRLLRTPDNDDSGWGWMIHNRCRTTIWGWGGPRSRTATAYPGRRPPGIPRTDSIPHVRRSGTGGRRKLSGKSSGCHARLVSGTGKRGSTYSRCSCRSSGCSTRQSRTSASRLPFANDWVHLPGRLQGTRCLEKPLCRPGQV